MDIERIAFGLFFFVISIFILVASAYSLRFVREFQKGLKKVIGFAPSFDERQMKIMGYLLPVVFFILGITMMVASGYMLADALGFW